MKKTYKIIYKVDMEINGVYINETISETATLEEDTYNLIISMVEDINGIDIVSCDEVVKDDKTPTFSLVTLMRIFGK